MKLCRLQYSFLCRIGMAIGNPCVKLNMFCSWKVDVTELNSDQWQEFVGVEERPENAMAERATSTMVMTFYHHILKMRLACRFASLWHLGHGTAFVMYFKVCKLTMKNMQAHKVKLYSPLMVRSDGGGKIKVYAGQIHCYMSSWWVLVSVDFPRQVSGRGPPMRTLSYGL